MLDPLTSVVKAEHAERLIVLTEEALSFNTQEAKRLAGELVDIMQILHGPCHPEVGIAFFYLALALEECGDIEESIEVRRRACQMIFGHQLPNN